MTLLVALKQLTYQVCNLLFYSYNRSIRDKCAFASLICCFRYMGLVGVFF